ncbi:hypothetical protein EJ08DRAFT_579448 [Tothia fuscella]|uniref:Uncharacterized protein n=1 Tax=Tothia fuscella TaxID=1048955 RepID=A0A9P4U2Q8_9PEZI|nr:hypothetical protein EJ08DRAFT_579448 [Tothia fuscella]
MPIVQRRPQLFRRQVNRAALCLFCLLAFWFTHSYRRRSWRRSVQVPILGARPSELSLYFPPIGHDFHPKIAAYNVYRPVHPRTPLFMPFTRNNTMLRQAVLSYIAAGWPRNDIVIVDNTGTMDANQKHFLSEENPFYLDYDIFRRRYGVAILQTPTLLNFAQLQNFMLRTAVTRDWPFYFWSHMDIAVLSAEDILPYKSFYHRVIDVKEKLLAKRFHKRRQWAIKFFDFDNLALVNVEAWRHIGPWDVFIPYYNTDCDAYARIKMHGYRKDDVQAGYVFDIAGVVEDPEIRFFPAENKSDRSKWGVSPDGPEQEGGELDTPRFQWLKSELQELMDEKNSNEMGRNTWQGTTKTHQPRKMPEQWSYDPEAFQTAWWAMADYGRAMYIKKWGTLECDLPAVNKTLKDAWLPEHLDEKSKAYKDREAEEDYWNGVLSEGAIR